MVTISAAEEQKAIIEALQRVGCARGESEAQAHMLVEADLRGRPSHGLQRLPTLIERIRQGVLLPGAKIEVERRTPAFLAVDGGGGFGPHVANQALDLAMASIEGLRIALVAIRNSSHLGMLAPYLETIVANGLIGIALTTTEALVHPAGGRVPLIGTNPIGVGIPVEGEPPFVLDMSTGAISAGEIIAHAQRGLPLPPGCAIDENGREAVDAERALRGAISPAGGGKGYGLGLAFELLVGILSDTALGCDVLGTLDVDKPVTKGDVFIVIDPRESSASWPGSRIADYLHELRASPPAMGSRGVRIPGDRAREERERRLRDGISVPAALWRSVTTLRGEPQDGDRDG
jgi:LDH2 family malate/lactate/ureidoglycolate dehydrogenase